MKNHARLLLLNLAASLAAFVAGGCDQLLPNNTPTDPQKVVVEVKVIDGKISVNDATINVKATSASEPSSVAVCTCGCAKAGCTCSSGMASAAPIASNQGSKPQVITQTQMVYQCRNGVCGWYPVEVNVPSATAAKRSAGPTTQREKVTIYDNGSPAGQAMREAIGSKGVDWKRQVSPVPINGTHWSPTAVKPNGSAWTPGAGGWHSQSAAQFQAWLAQ